jgi:uncharacterized membrane protein
MTNLEFQRGAIDAGGCISNGWNMLKENYGLYLGISLIAMVLGGCIPCISLFLVGPIIGGVYYVVLRQMRGEPVEFGMMFQGFQKFVPLMVIGVIQSIPEIIGQVLRFGVNIGQLGLDSQRGNADFFQSSDSRPDLAIASGILIIVALVAFVFILFAIVWRVLLFFALPLAMEYDLGPVDAIKMSARAAMGNIGGLILLFILEGLIVLAGMLMCVLGMFLLSLPLVYVANAFAYRQVFPLIESRFNTAPPPPSAYGGGYGQQNFGV